MVKGVGQSLKLSSEFYSASLYVFQFSSVQLSPSGIPGPLQPHGLQEPGFPVNHQPLRPTHMYVH